MIKNLKNKKKKGFTLIELIIVIAIIAILAAVALPKFGEVRQNANRNADIANGKTIAGAVTTLMAEEKIVIGSKEFVIGNGTVVDGTVAPANGESAALLAYLQSAPTPKVSKTNNKFIVKVTANGTVTVHAAASTITGSGLAAANQVYPEVVPTANHPYYPSN